MVLVNTDFISGKELQTLGLVKGTAIYSKPLGQDIVYQLNTLTDSKLESTIEMVNDASTIATKRMIEEAERLGADGVINLRFTSFTIMEGTTEVITYGTAIKFVYPL